MMTNIFLSIFVIIAAIFSVIATIMMFLYYGRVKKVYNVISKTNQVTKDTLFEADKANEEILKNLYSAKISAEAIKLQLRDMGIILDQKHYKKLLIEKYPDNNLLRAKGDQ